MQGSKDGRPGGAAYGQTVEAIVVIGVSGSGKTTVGARLAPALNATFLEGDDYHPAANVAKMRSGQPLDDDDRAPWLAALGRAIAARCEEGRSVVAACSALRRAYRERLATAARRPLVFIHLAMPPSTLQTRLQARAGHFMPASLLHSQLHTLEPLAAGEDGTEIDETGTTEQTVAAIRHWLDLRGRR